MGFIYGMAGDDESSPGPNNVLGVVTIFQYGAGSAGVTRTLGKYMVGSGATFR